MLRATMEEMADLRDISAMTRSACALTWPAVWLGVEQAARMPWGEVG